MVCVILFMAASVVATASNVPDAVKDVVKEKGLDESEINSVNSVNYSSLPKEIDIENIDKTNLEIYEVGVAKEKLFVLTFGGEQEEKPVLNEQRQFLSFGYSGEIAEGFLQSASGVTMGQDRGYVMMRDGSITGISTNLESLED